MKPKIVKANALNEYFTRERCFITENYSSTDNTISVARAKVAPGITTAKHHLEEVNEIYLITNGEGEVEIGALEPTNVGVGDLIIIPAGTSQRITNIGKDDLLFYCICTPRFNSTCYFDEKAKK